MTILELAAIILTSFSTIVFLVVAISNYLQRQSRDRLRLQRINIYAQLAEAFVEWGGLVPLSTSKFNLKKGGIWYSVAADRFGVRQPNLEAIAMSQELRERILAQTGGIDAKPSSAEYKEQFDDLDRLALVHTCDGTLGPFPVGWTRHLYCLDRKGKLAFPRIEVLPNGDPRAYGTGDGSDCAHDA